MANPISNLGLIPNFTVGGRVFTDLSSNLKVLTGYCSANTRSGLFEISTAGATAYQVPGGKTFTAYAVRIHNGGGGTVCKVDFAYGDTSITVDSGSTPTNEVFFGFNGGGGLGKVTAATSSPLTPPVSFAEWAGFSMSVPTGKYAHIKIDTAITMHVWIYGYEV